MAGKGKDSLLKVGWWVVVTLKPDTAPLRCYAGQIQALGPEGMRITLVDWITGTAVSWDLFIPQANIDSILVCTDQHDPKAFGEACWKMADANAQKRMLKPKKPPTPPEAEAI
jgi:hypothetical protein